MESDWQKRKYVTEYDKLGIYTAYKIVMIQNPLFTSFLSTLVPIIITNVYNNTMDIKKK